MFKYFLVMAFAIFMPVAHAQTETSIENEADVVIETDSEEVVAETAKPAIALFYADWCGSCKILDPKLNAAIEQMDNQDAFQIITFDLTDETTTQESLTLAEENDLTNLYLGIAPRTGMAVLIKDGKEMARLTKANSVEDIKGQLDTLIGTN
jgi:thiol-disulfide isomerase/thioredoxin